MAIFKAGDAFSKAHHFGYPAVNGLPATIMAGQPNPPKVHPPRNKGLIAGHIKGNQWLVSPY